ncbi:hypothetical protein HOY82DRAFT_538517 [Tuber indicum]|nr:hypothetical protein HOY82DRAFT_538517 [Tuber indicum]
MAEKLEEIEVAEERKKEGGGYLGSRGSLGYLHSGKGRSYPEFILGGWASLPIDRVEDTKLSIKGLAKDFLIEGIKVWKNDGRENGDVEVDFEEDFDEEINFAYE